MVQKAYADTRLLQEQLANPLLWNTYPYRTDGSSPHREMSDVWIRYNAIENLGPKFTEQHESVWYPVANTITEARRLSLQICADFGGKVLGGVLITKLPPGKRCYPHIDQGWHAKVHRKLALQIKGNRDQRFHVLDEVLTTESGDLFEFSNDVLHGVDNDSEEDRITMIVCIREH
jgi:Aspartyl/Asparaginyl beta-hydroxylase